MCVLPLMPLCGRVLGVAIKIQRCGGIFKNTRDLWSDLSSRQGIQWMLVENEIDLRSARLLVLDAAAKCDRGLPLELSQL